MSEAAQYPGTSPGGGRWRRRAGALFTGASLCAALLHFQTPPAHAEDDSDSRSAEVAIDSLTPTGLTKGGTVLVSGSVTNDGRSTITDAHIGVHVDPGGPLTSRGAIKASSARDGFTAADGQEISSLATPVKDIETGITMPFNVEIPVAKLGLGKDGVYQIGISVGGRTKEASHDRILGIERSFLPWYNADGAKSTRFTFLWPVVDRPHLAVRKEKDRGESPIFLDDDLATDLAPGGRLQQLVEIGESLPITWVIDPDLLATVETMTGGYRVVGPDGDLQNTTAGSGGAVAEQWLNSLKTATDGEEVIALPFGDSDIASIAHRGKDVPGTLGDLKTATDLALTTVETILGTAPTTDVAWPVEGAIDPSIVDVAKAGGADKVIARSDSLREPGSLTYTPTAARPIGSGTTAVVADAALSTAFKGDMARAANATLAVQEFVSQTLLITMQEPAKQRSIVVAPQRMPTASQARAMAQGIAAVTQGGWAESITFDAATKATPDPAARRGVPKAGAYPERLRKQELDTAAFQDIQAVRNKLTGFAVILTNTERAMVPFTSGVLRSLSTQWRDDAARGDAFRDAIGIYLDELISAVYIVQKSELTLSGRSGTIPVTVRNDLTQDVTGLVLKITPLQKNRLEVREAQPVAVGGGLTRSLKFETTASANGLTQVTAQLYTKEGVLYGPPMKFDVNVTSITDTAMLVIAGGLLLLVLAGMRLYRQRQRNARAQQDDDTEPENSGPSPTGEKVDR